jgi:hypothetical protein
MNIVQAIDDPKLLGAAIKDPATWFAWRTLLKAFFGLPIRMARRNSRWSVRAAQSFEQTLSRCSGLSAAGEAARAL